MGIFPFDVGAPTNRYLADQTPCYTLFDTGASKAKLDRKYCDKHSILHQYPKYPMNVQPIPVSNDQLMTVK